jgi:NADH dehydrogenase
LKTIFIAGATGFVGSHIAKKLIAGGHKVIGLVHRHSDDGLKGIEMEKRDGSTTLTIKGSLLDLESLRRAVRGANVLINAVGIIKEVKGKTFDAIHRQGVENLIAAARENGIQRFIQISALGTGTGIDTAYFRTKEAGEKALASSGLDWTIFRPAMIFGPGDGFSTQMLAMMKKAPFMPVAGDGKYRLQMVYIEDVAECVLCAIENPRTYGQTYCLGGPDIMAFNEVLDFLMRWKNIKRLKVHIPFWIMRPMAALMEAVLPNPPVTPDQLKMLTAERVCDSSVAAQIFGVKFKAWQEAIKEYS